MKAPLNYPCVMFEKINTIGINLSENDLLKKYALIKNENDFNKMKIQFKEPTICHYYTVVNKAIEIENIFKS